MRGLPGARQVEGSSVSAMEEAVAELCQATFEKPTRDKLMGQVRAVANAFGRAV